GVLMAQLHKSEITAIWVQSKLPHYPETISEVKQEQNGAVAFAHKLETEVKHISKKMTYPIKFIYQQGHTTKTIVTVAEKEHFDLVIVGSTGHSNLWGRLLGHTADMISENAHCDVLIVKK
ncbi:MAG: universal stress protein, partial [Ignavibacteria bacterium]|nr:universal stress protein [Ignavibacteria bacterium]